MQSKLSLSPRKFIKPLITLTTICITHIFHLVVEFNFAQVFRTANHSL